MTDYTSFWYIVALVLLAWGLNYVVTRARCAVDNDNTKAHFALAFVPMVMILAVLVSWINLVWSPYERVPVTYLTTWAILLSVPCIWALVGMFRRTWASEFEGLTRDVLKLGFIWGNHFSKKGNRDFPGTKNNFWGTASGIVAILFIVSFFSYGSPWHSDGSREINTAKTWANEGIELVKTGLTSAKDEAKSLVTRGMKEIDSSDEFDLRENNSPIGWFTRKLMGEEEKKVSATVEEEPEGFFTVVDIQPDFPRTWGWLWSTILISAWAIFANLWCRRDGIAPGLRTIVQSFVQAFKSSKAGQAVTAGSQSTPATTSTASPTTTQAPTPSVTSGSTTTSSPGVGGDLGVKILGEFFASLIEQRMRNPRR